MFTFVRYLIALFISWWVLAFIVAGIGAVTAGNPEEGAKIWVLGLAVLVAFPVQAKLPLWQDD